MGNLLKNWGGLLVLALVAFGLPFLLTSSSGLALPAELAGLPLVQSTSGGEAALMVDRFHGRRVAREENLVGRYSKQGQSATLYLTKYPTSSEADSIEGRMSGAITSGDYGFNHLHRMVFRGEPVSACIGHGQIHFFFAEGNRLFWLAADYPVAVEAVNDLLASRGR